MMSRAVSLEMGITCPLIRRGSSGVEAFFLQTALETEAERSGITAAHVMLAFLIAFIFGRFAACL